MLMHYYSKYVTQCFNTLAPEHRDMTTMNASLNVNEMIATITDN